MNRNVLRCYGHVKRMEEERIVKRVYIAKVEGSRARGRPKMKWTDSVKASVEMEEGGVFLICNSLFEDEWRMLWSSSL
jgi:hypothetical protein